MRASKRISSAVCVVAAVLVTGCGHGTETHPVVDTSLLQPGNYRTTPRSPEEVRTAATLDIQEALRLGEAIPLIMETDPRLIFGRVQYQQKLYTQRRPPRMTDNLSSDLPGFTVGFSTVGQRREEETLGRTVQLDILRFAEPAQAAHAAKFLADRAWTSRYPPVGPIAIPGYPEALGVVGGYGAVTTWIARDEYLLKSYIGAGVDIPPDAAALAGLTQAIFDTQLGRLRGFQPAPDDASSGLPVETENILRYSLPGPEDEAEAVMPAEVALHFTERPDLFQRAFEDARVDLIVQGGADIFRAGDVAAAERVQAFLVSRLDSEYEPVDPPAGLPGAKCAENPEEAGSLQCVFTVGRYAVRIDGAGQVQDLHQQVAAQYLLLEQLPGE